jgi:alcohol dehydrogenase
MHASSRHTAMTPGLQGFDYQPRTRVIFGDNTLVRVGELARELGGQRVLLVTDKGIAAAGHPARAVEYIEAAGLKVTVYDEVRENPSTVDVDRCVAVAREAQIDLIVGLGGGSSMDTAKGSNFILSNGGHIKDYWGVGKAIKPMLPLIAIPTTAGTGSECQSYALISDEKTHLKMACGDPKAAAKVAILEPLLTVSQPPRVTACTGVDTLVHSLETAVTKKRTPLSANFSREAFRLCVGGLERVLRDPQDIEARGMMQLSAAFAGTAIENSMLGAAHAAANPLTAHFGIVHGQAVGLMIPAVIRYNARDPLAHERYLELSAAVDLGPIDEFVAELEVLLDVAKVRENLAQYAIDSSQFPVLAQEAAQQWTAGFNPRAIGAEDFVQLYEEVFG